MVELEPDKRKKLSYTDSNSEFLFFIDRYGKIKKYIESERKEMKKEIVR